MDTQEALKRLLLKLADLDHTSSIDIKSLKLIECGGYSDIYIGYLVLGETKVKIAVKRLRVNMYNDFEFAKVR